MIANPEKGGCKMNNIIESIGAWGVVTTSGTHRLVTPKSGDIVDLIEVQGEYPFIYSRYGRIETVGPGRCGWCKEDEAHICCDMGSAFLNEDGTVSISGGPFKVIKLQDLEPTYELYEATYWNWGNNGPGSHHGVYYKIQRPVFRLKKR
jgi:hypothetical protein